MIEKKIEKRPPGRPKGNRETCRFTIVLDVAMSARIEKSARAQAVSRGEVVRRVLESGVPK